MTLHLKVTDLLESVSLSPNSGQHNRPMQAPGGPGAPGAPGGGPGAPGGGRAAPVAPMPRPLEGHNSAPDLLPG